MTVRHWQSLQGSTHHGGPWFPPVAQGKGTGAPHPVLGAALPVEGCLASPVPWATPHTAHCLCWLPLSSDHHASEEQPNSVWGQMGGQRAHTAQQLSKACSGHSQPGA